MDHNLFNQSPTQLVSKYYLLITYYLLEMGDIAINKKRVCPKGTYIVGDK